MSRNPALLEGNKEQVDKSEGGREPPMGGGGDSIMVEPGSNSPIHMPIAVDPNTIWNKGRGQSDSHWRWCSRVQPVRMRMLKRVRTASRTPFTLLDGMDLPKPFFMDTGQCLQFLH